MSKMNTKNNNHEEESSVLPDLNNADEARKAFLAAEIFNRKY